MKIFSDSCWFSISIFTTSHYPAFISCTLVPCSTHTTHTHLYTSCPAGQTASIPTVLDWLYCIWGCFVLDNPVEYCIVLSKHPWALAAQAPKIEGGWLHREGAWIVQLSPSKGPPQMRSKLPGCTASSLHASSRPARQWRKLYRATKADRLVASLPSFRSIQSSFAVHKFRAAGKERCKRGYRRVCATLWWLMMWHPKRNSSYVSSADLPSDSKCKNI